MREPKAIQIMPLPLNAADRFTDQDIVGLALMDDGDIRPIVMYFDDDFNYFVGTYDPKEGALEAFGKKLVEWNMDLKAAKNELWNWDNKDSAALTVLKVASSIHTIAPGANPQPILENILGVTPEEADLLLQGEKEITAPQLVVLCKKLLVPIEGLRDSKDSGCGNLYDLPF